MRYYIGLMPGFARFKRIMRQSEQGEWEWARDGEWASLLHSNPEVYLPAYGSLMALVEFEIKRHPWLEDYI